ncbi:MAG: DUF3786 domain-containing protein [Lachnospiraceae bacterium]|nr:DUF3786 domain-containing protein [Lachnospiraceae bacterium]
MNTSNVSNYDAVLNNWRQKFLAMDHEALARRFRLAIDDEALYITYYAHPLRIGRRSGDVRYEGKPEVTPPFNTAITIYNLFHYAVDRPAASGKLVPFYEVKRVYPFEQAYRQTILKKLEGCFTGHVAELKQACEKLGGRPLSQGDAGYELPVFPFFTIAVLFWDADEEFASQANMLFDSNITDFLHEENVVGVASDAVYYLTEAAGLVPKEIYGG